MNVSETLTGLEGYRCQMLSGSHVLNLIKAARRLDSVLAMGLETLNKQELCEWTDFHSHFHYFCLHFLRLHAAFTPFASGLLGKLDQFVIHTITTSSNSFPCLQIWVRFTKIHATNSSSFPSQLLPVNNLPAIPSCMCRLSCTWHAVNLSHIG